MTEHARLKPWQGVATVVVGMIMGVITQIAVLAAALLGAGTLDVESVATKFTVVAPLILFNGAAMAGAALLAPMLAKLPLRDALGLHGAPWPCFVAGPIGMLALGPTSDGMRRLMEHFLPGLTFGALNQLDAMVRSGPVWLIVPLVALAPGVSEELLFRGALQRSIRTPAIAIVVSAISFAVIHADPHHVVAVLPLGFYLAWLGHRTRSTWVPITAHVANNAAAGLGAIYLAEDEPAALPAEELWWIPAGWVIAAVMIAVVWRSTRQRAT